MQISNPLQINDWEIKKFLKVILTFQLVMLGSIGLDAMGLEIPIIKQFIGFVYLTFVPGIIILRIIKIHKLSNIEALLYTVGLSVAFLMFTGLFMNIFYPLFGISRPISIVPLVITISIILLVLCFLGYERDKNFACPCYIDLQDILSPPALFLYMLPFLSISGTYMVYFHNSNIILMFLIILIAFIVVSVAFNRFISKKFYSLTVIVIAIALLYHRSLISPYLTGPDIPIEYYFSNLIVTNSYWDSTIASSFNGVLSTTILPAIYTVILGIDTIWIYKIFYPLLLSLVPLGLYYVFNQQTDEKTAFLSAFFFISLVTFFITLTYMARQQIAELFFVLLILLLLNKKIDALKKAGLSIIFSISMIVSHYGLSYVYMIYLITGFILVYFLNDFFKIKTNGKYVVLYSIIIISWYIYVSDSVLFNSIVKIGEHIYTSIFTEFFAVESRDSTLSKFLGIESASSFWREIGYRIYQITQLFIVIGLFKVLKERMMKFDSSYIAYSITSMFLLLLVVILPFFATNIGTSRIYHITLFFLAPFCIIGGEAVFKGIKKLFVPKSVLSSKHALGALVIIVLIPYFFYSTGFIFEVTGDAPTSLSLGLERMKGNDNVNVTAAFNIQYVWDQDIASAQWLYRHNNKNGRIFADIGSGTRGNIGILGSYYSSVNGEISDIAKVDTKNELDYIYMRYMNVVNRLAIGDTPKFRSGVYDIYNINEIYPLIENKNKIYDNAGSEVYQ